ncbi:hypothetical protein FD754_001555 [Muntiacus muntjak]|uniref:Uncharacterized protein n=1 Tax=Muntiacus muntjak TaxID=9888 RepID=A0A5N3W6T1_MUNMU|nr:hypothetical protein FD754_001555 [Muntiacus muntjak]
MPRYYEDKPEGGACAGVKEDLGVCLLQSDCVLKSTGKPGLCRSVQFSRSVSSASVLPMNIQG